MAHAFFSPSSAPRVVNCPGSLMLTLDMPDTQSREAAEGTAAHKVGDLCLSNNWKVERYAGCTIAVAKDGSTVFQHENNREEIALDVAFGERFLFDVDEEMINAVQDYVDWCNDAPGDKYTECRVDISRWCPKIDPNDIFAAATSLARAYEPQFGTSDHATCAQGKLIITDLKYGKGVKVYAERNEQAILYALGFIDEWDWLYDFEEVEIRICQPRLDHKDVWVTTKAELQEIGRYILERFTLALQPDAPFQAGEKQCKFCKASGRCKAQADHLSKIHALAFDDLDATTFKVPDPRLLTDGELVEAWKQKKLYDARFDAIEREMYRCIGEGIKLPGVRLVESKTHRRWIDPSAIEADLEFLGVPRDKIHSEVKVISLNQARKYVPKSDVAILESLAYKPRGEPCIVHEGDPRPDYAEAANERANAAFDDLDDPFA